MEHHTSLAGTPVLIDGSWLLRCLCSGVRHENIKVDTAGLARDIRDISPGLGALHWFDATRADKDMFITHQDLAITPGVMLHLGSLRSRNGTWTQKQTDSLIVTTMADMALMRCSDIVLIGGDEDLVPGIRFAQDLGSKVHLWSIQEPGRDSTPADSALAGAADTLSVLDVSALRTHVTSTVHQVANAMAQMAAS